MSTETYLISTEKLSEIHKQMGALKLILDEMEDEDRLSRRAVYFEGIDIYEAMMGRFKETQMLVDKFDNAAPESKGNKPVDIECGIYSFSGLAHSLNRYLNMLGLDALQEQRNAERYNNFLKSLDKFDRIAASLQTIF